MTALSVPLGTAEIVLFTPDAPAGLDLAQLLAIFDETVLRWLAKANSQRTRDSYARALRLYRASCDRWRLNPLGLDAVIAFSASQNAQHGQIANGTIRLRLKAVQSFLSWCYLADLTTLKPELVADSLTLPPARELSPRDILTVAEVQRLLGAAAPGRDRLLLTVLVEAGLRVSEATALTVADIYTADDRCYIHVARGKGDKVREVEITPTLFVELRRYAAGWREDRRLFAIDRGNVWRLAASTAERAGIEKNVTPHSLRHTHGHHMRLANMPLEVLSARLGHASIETTKTYTRPAELARALPLPAMPWNASATASSVPVGTTWSVP